jgi:hypothetical protein
MAAWSYSGAEGYRELPELNVACSGLAVGASKKDWERFGGRDERLKAGMGQLWELFKDAPTLGSLIDPTRGNGDLFMAEYEELKPLLQEALEEEDPRDYEGRELGVTAQGMAKAAQMLADKYHLVTTNPPYLGRRYQDSSLKSHCERFFAAAKADLAVVFCLRAMQGLDEDSTIAFVLPQNWLFLVSFSQFRRQVLDRVRLQLIAVLGEGAFRSSSAAGAFPTLLLASYGEPASSYSFGALDVAQARGTPRRLLATEPLSWRGQREQQRNPGSRIVTTGRSDTALLKQYASSFQGIMTGDNNRYIRCYWEFVAWSDRWERLQRAGDGTQLISGCYQLLDWRDDGSHLARPQGLSALGRSGPARSVVRNLHPSVFLGTLFDGSLCPILAKNEEDAPAVLAFCLSDEFERSIRRIDRKIVVTTATFLAVPFDVDRWRGVAEERYPNGLPEPSSEDPTQWIFQGTIAPSDAPLQVAVARLVGYRWPEQIDDQLDDLIDEDGIVCIPPVRGEQPAADRLRQVLSRAYGDDWTPGLIESLLTDIDYEGKSLNDWLRNGFFQQHHDLFQKCPFIWHIWDGRAKDGFHALVNYHKLDQKRLETLTYSYLGDWIRRQQEELKQEKGGAEGRLEAAKDLQRRLELILEGEPPYDIFVRWKPIEEQPIGWKPDLDDGVRLNIRPFMKADILRRKPKIHWKKDRGKDPEEAPWYHLFQGDRINDHHLSRDEKLAARKSAGEGE